MFTTQSRSLFEGEIFLLKLSPFQVRRQPGRRCWRWRGRSWRSAEEDSSPEDRTGGGLRVPVWSRLQQYVYSHVIFSVRLYIKIISIYRQPNAWPTFCLEGARIGSKPVSRNQTGTTVWAEDTGVRNTFCQYTSYQFWLPYYSLLMTRPVIH